MRERGFDLAGRLRRQHDSIGNQPRRAVDRVAHEAHFAPIPERGTPILDGEPSLVFSSNNYLGLATDRRIVDATADAVRTVGSGAGASRATVGTTLVHHDLETRLAEVTGTERALTFCSEYAAVAGTIAALDPDVVFVDECASARIFDGCRLADADVIEFAHTDADDLDARLAERADDTSPTPPAASNGGSRSSWLVATDTVFDAPGETTSVGAICGAAERHGAWVLVDDTHGIGLYEDGSGIVGHEDSCERVDVQIGSFSAALASQGGYVAGSSELVEFLSTEARSFTDAAGLAPPSAAAAAEALHVARVSSLRDRLWRNVSHLRTGLVDLGYEVRGDTQILSVEIGDQRTASQLADRLFDRRIAVRTEKTNGSASVRVTPIATHEIADLERCLDAFRCAGRELDVI